MADLSYIHAWIGVPPTYRIDFTVSLYVAHCNLTTSEVAPVLVNSPHGYDLNSPKFTIVGYPIMAMIMWYPTPTATIEVGLLPYVPYAYSYDRGWSSTVCTLRLQLRSGLVFYRINLCFLSQVICHPGRVTTVKNIIMARKTFSRLQSYVRADLWATTMSMKSTADKKDLGVVVDKGLKFHLHVSKAVSKASRMLGLVRATFSCLDESTVPRLFTTMVRPHLEYGNIIWHPR